MKGFLHIRFLDKIFKPLFFVVQQTYETCYKWSRCSSCPSRRRWSADERRPLIGRGTRHVSWRTCSVCCHSAPWSSSPQRRTFPSSSVSAAEAERPALLFLSPRLRWWFEPFVQHNFYFFTYIIFILLYTFSKHLSLLFYFVSSMVCSFCEKQFVLIYFYCICVFK